jgi:hypothetical protein
MQKSEEKLMNFHHKYIYEIKKISQRVCTNHHSDGEIGKSRSVTSKTGAFCGLDVLAVAASTCATGKEGGGGEPKEKRT